MLELKVENVAISDVVLDVRNPRIAPWIETVTGTPSEDWILLALGKHPGSVFGANRHSADSSGRSGFPMIVGAIAADQPM